MNLPLIMIRCLLYTIIIEIIVALILNVKNKKDLSYIIIVNIITNPIVVSLPVIIYLKYGHLSRIISLYFLEILTIFFEGFIYLKKLNYKNLNPFILSLLLNLSSYLIGEIINMF